MPMEWMNEHTHTNCQISLVVHQQKTLRNPAL
jgi:hypothetical protein